MGIAQIAFESKAIRERHELTRIQDQESQDPVSERNGFTITFSPDHSIY